MCWLGKSKKYWYLKKSIKKHTWSSPWTKGKTSCLLVRSLNKNSGAAVSREERGLGIAVTFSVAWECVGMAWLMQIIIAGESQLLWSSRHPQGPSRWNEMHYRILCASFWQRFVFPLCWSPCLSVNSAVNGTLPCLRALSGSDELLLHKAGRSCLLEKRMNYILLCLSSLSIQDKALLFWPFLTALSQRPWAESRVAELWCKRHFCGIFMSRTNRNISHLLLSLVLFSQTDLLQDWRSWDHTRWRCISRMYKDYRTSRVAGKRPECVLVPVSTPYVSLSTEFYSKAPEADVN